MTNDHKAGRRKVLGAGVAILGGGLVESASAQQKVQKPTVQYQDQPKNGAECDQCVHFVAPSSCKLVDGTIAPKGWCLLFVKKPS